MYSTLFSKIQNVADISSNREETWVSLSLRGQYQQQYSKTIFLELHDVFENMGKAGCITYQMGNTIIQIDELRDSLVDGAQWSISINKQSFMDNGDKFCNFFFDLNAFRQWAERTDPLSDSNPFNGHACKIGVNGLQSPFGGPNFCVFGNGDNISEEWKLEYSQDYLMSVLRQFTETKKEIHPEKHYVSFGGVDENSYPFYRNSLMCLSVALCDELYEEKVVLRGIRRLEFNLQLPHYEIGQIEHVQKSLCEAFRWIYSGDSRYELRHKLLIDRLTLDLPLNQSYYDGIIILIDHALRQANERYNYAFFERSSEYQKELQQFLKELHSLCDSYSTKVRSLLGNFLRDALAGFLTVAITIFARIRDLERLDSENILTYIFCAYGVYLLISCLFQVIVDWRDLCLSEKEIDYWKTVSREYMDEQDFETHKRETVVTRKKWAIHQYIYVAILYIAFAVFCFNVPKLWNKLSSSSEITEFSNDQSNTETIFEDTFKIDNLRNGKNTLSGDCDTTVYHSPGRKQE